MEHLPAFRERYGQRVKPEADTHGAQVFALLAQSLANRTNRVIVSDAPEPPALAASGDAGDADEKDGSPGAARQCPPVLPKRS